VLDSGQRSSPPTTGRQLTDEQEDAIEWKVPVTPERCAKVSKSAAVAAILITAQKGADPTGCVVDGSVTLPEGTSATQGSVDVRGFDPNPGGGGASAKAKVGSGSAVIPLPAGDESGEAFAVQRVVIGSDGCRSARPTTIPVRAAVEVREPPCESFGRGEARRVPVSSEVIECRAR
jgi:hypothetical protein